MGFMPLVHYAQSDNNACLVLSSRTKWSAIKIEEYKDWLKKAQSGEGIFSSCRRGRLCRRPDEEQKFILMEDQVLWLHETDQGAGAPRSLV